MKSAQNSMVWGKSANDKIGTMNVREDELNTRLGYTVVILDHWHNTCTVGVMGDIWVLNAGFFDDLTGFSWYGLNSMGLKFSMSF